MTFDTAIQQTGYLLAHPEEFDQKGYETNVARLGYLETHCLAENVEFVAKIELIDKSQSALEDRALPYQFCSALDAKAWSTIKTGASSKKADYLISADSMAKICGVVARILQCTPAIGVVSAVLMTHLVVESSLKIEEDYSFRAKAVANEMTQIIRQRLISF